MEEFKTIYDICSDALYLASYNISNIYGDNENDLLAETLKFLITDNSRFEEMIFQNLDLKLREDKILCKKIMMLIVISSSYYLSLYQYDRNISSEFNYEIIQELENLTPSNIFDMFYDFKENPIIFNYIEDYYTFSGKNYIFKNSCLENLLNYNKLHSILKINPFELLNFSNYLKPENMLNSERYIQDFIDLYDGALDEIKTQSSIDFEDYETSDFVVDNGQIMDLLRQKIIEHFDYDKNKVNKFYSYIFSNIYETLTVLIKKDHFSNKKYQRLLNLFDSCDGCYNYLYYAFMKNDEFAMNLVDFFIETNDDIFADDLVYRRLGYKEVGDIDILKKLNPYYDEENIVFDHIIKKIKKYRN